MGYAPAALLLWHGSANIAQSTGLTRDNFAAYSYIGMADALGVENPEKVGRWVHWGVDLAGTGASAFSKVPKPDARKLYNWLPSDLQYSIQTPTGALGVMRDGAVAFDSAEHMN